MPLATLVPVLAAARCGSTRYPTLQLLTQGIYHTRKAAILTRRCASVATIRCLEHLIEVIFGASPERQPCVVT